MILLVDDNSFDQMSENYGYNVLDFISQKSDIIKYKPEIKEVDLGKLATKFEGLFIHDSLPEKELKEKLIALFVKANKSVVIFSGQFPKTTFDNLKPTQIIRGIKKNRFYQNLPIFLNKLEEENILQINLLSLGSNYDKKRANLINRSLSLYATLLKKKGSFSYNESLIEFPRNAHSKSEYYKYWEELYFLAHPSHKEEDFENFDEEKREKTSYSYHDFLVDLEALTKIVGND